MWAGFVSIAMTGQTQPPAPKRVPPAKTAPVENKSNKLTTGGIIAMAQAGLSEDVIVTKLRKENQSFDLSPEDLIRLKKANVSDNTIKVMLDPTAPLTSAALAPAAAVANPPASVVPDAKPAAPSTPSLDIGVYVKKGQDWMEVRPEVVNWKTGGTIKSLASAGVVKKDLNGNLDGPSSKTSVTSPVEVLIVAPEGIAAEEYQFLRLRVNKDYREFRSVTGGILNQRSGAMRDLIPFEAKKISSRHFLVVMPANVSAGEYGFLPPGTGGSSTTNAVSSQYGKMYTFQIIE